MEQRNSAAILLGVIFILCDFASARLEAPTNRQQGCSSMEKEQFHFFLHNQAKRPVLVDGLPVHRGTKTRLKEGSMIEASCDVLTIMLMTMMVVM